jgi:hypothetical protein
MASERYRSNIISQIHDNFGGMISDHAEKSALFYREFKSRLGSTVPISMQFDLHSIIQAHNDLDHLCLPFSHEEIDKIVLELPMDKALGPNGFNILFFKKAWPIIKNDFYKHCDDFFYNQADLKSI